MSLTTTKNRKTTTLPRPVGDRSSASSSQWTRPSDWLALPDISSTNNRFVGLLRIDQESNFVALSCSVTGGYTVDWGDGTTTNHASGTTALKQYTYSSISNTGESSLGYRQAVVTVYPQTAGQNITSFSLQVRHTQTGLNASYAAPWLDVAINASAVSSLSLGGTTINLRFLQQATIFNHNTTTMVNQFFNCHVLRSIPLFNTASVTTMSSMFSNCYSLTSVPLFNTASVTTMSSMFSSCYSLTSVPLFNTASVTNMNSMFNGCTSLTSVPLFNTASVTNMSSMFSSCYSLTSVPLFNTASVTNMNSMFLNCS